MGRDLCLLEWPELRPRSSSVTFCVILVGPVLAGPLFSRL